MCDAFQSNDNKGIYKSVIGVPINTRSGTTASHSEVLSTNTSFYSEIDIVKYKLAKDNMIQVDLKNDVSAGYAHLYIRNVSGQTFNSIKVTSYSNLSYSSDPGKTFTETNLTNGQATSTEIDSYLTGIFGFYNNFNETVNANVEITIGTQKYYYFVVWSSYSGAGTAGTAVRTELHAYNP